MSQDTSDSSSSDEEVLPQTNEAPRPKRTTRYECPEEFTSASYAPCGSARGQSAFDENKELWLIKAPASFDPRSLSGKKLSLMCLQSVKTRDSGTGQQILSVLGRRSTSTGFRLLTNDPSRADAHVCAPAFSGMLNISESYGDCSSNQGPIPVPAAPAPRLPDGLRQRFLPFGSARPARGPTETPEEASEPAPAVVVKREPDKEETPRKRKKEKRIKVEVEEDVAAPLLVKVEQPDQDTAQQPTPNTQVTEERKEKKKKKKKDKEKDRETVVVKTELNEDFDPYVIIKQEALGGDYVDSEPVPKKKKKKKSKTDD